MPPRINTGGSRRTRSSWRSRPTPGCCTTWSRTFPASVSGARSAACRVGGRGRGADQGHDLRRPQRGRARAAHPLLPPWRGPGPTAARSSPSSPTRAVVRRRCGGTDSSRRRLGEGDRRGTIASDPDMGADHRRSAESPQGTPRRPWHHVGWRPRSPPRPGRGPSRRTGSRSRPDRQPHTPLRYSRPPPTPKEFLCDVRSTRQTRRRRRDVDGHWSPASATWPSTRS